MRRIKYPMNARPDNDLGVGDTALPAAGISGRTAPKVTLTPIIPGKKRKVGETVEIGAAMARQIKKPNR